MNKYEIIGVVGEGAYGIVLKCRNKENNEISTFSPPTPGFRNAFAPVLGAPSSDLSCPKHSQCISKKKKRKTKQQQLKEKQNKALPDE